MSPLQVLLLVLMLVTGACASREVVTDEPIGIEWWEGPPCRVEVHDGDELVFRARSPHRCVITPGGD